MEPLYPGTLEDLLQHSAWLRPLARSLVGDAHAEDLVQETVLAAMRSPPDPSRPARPWLRQILINFGRMHVRSGGRAALREAASGLTPSQATAPDEHVARLQLQRRLCTLVLELPEPFRRTIVQRYLEDRSLAEIARADAVPEGTVRWRHKEALDRLRVALDRDANGDRTAWMAALAPFAGPSITTTTTGAGAGLLGGIIVNKVAVTTLLASVVILAIVSIQIVAPRIRPSASASAAPGATGEGRPGAPAAAPTPAPTGAIDGRVSGPDADRTAVMLYRVRAATSAPDVVAKATGPEFAFADLPPATYCVSAEAPLARAGACDLHLHAGERLTRTLTLKAPVSPIHGIVRDSGAGPVPSARISAWAPAGRDAVAVAQADAAGRFQLDVPPGWHQVRADADGYAPEVRMVEVVPGRALELVLHPGAAVRGIVIDGETNAPAAGARVTATIATGGRAHAQAGSDGRFAFGALAPGRHRLQASRGPAVSMSEEVALGLGDQGEARLVLSARGSVLEGRVVDAASGRPISAAVVRLDGAGGAQATGDAEGRYRFEGLAPDEYQLSVTADGYVHWHRSLLVTGRTQANAPLQRGATVRGRVVLADGSPVPGAAITSSAWTLDDDRLKDVRTGVDGAFVLSPVEPGRVEVAAHHPAHGLARPASVEIAVGGVAEVVLRFEQGSSVSGRVLLDNGQPAAGALVSIASEESGGAWTAAAGPDGRYDLHALPPGAYQLLARPAGTWSSWSVTHSPERVAVRLAERERKRVDLTVAGGRLTIRGSVVDAAGQAVPGAEISVERLLPGYDFAVTVSEAITSSAGDGTFAVEGLPRGEYRVVGEHPLHARAEVGPVRAGGAAVALRLPAAAAFHGRVIQDGRPVTAFKLTWSWRFAGQRRDGQRVFTDPEGRFAVAGAEPTSALQLSAETAGGAWGETAEIALPAGGNPEIQVVVAARGTVKGRLMRGDAPAAGYQLYLGKGAMPRTDAAGRFEAQLPPGQHWRIGVMTAGADLPPLLHPFEVKAGEVVDLGDLQVPEGQLLEESGGH